ncbi:MAG TPA: YciI family protein [Rhodocyclaceae bacterium]|nr:YciI family protein [Rhodocyclaceae bacterium]
MKYMLMHRTNANWEAGMLPSPELIGRVGALMGDIAKSGILVAGEGLRASSHGVRLNFTGGSMRVTKGPLTPGNELPGGFAIFQVESIDDAIAWTKRFGEILGDVEVDIRPLTEPWDIGIGSKPADMKTTRYMAMHKADSKSEAGTPPTPELMAAMGSLMGEMAQAGVLLSGEGLAPSSQGKRFKYADGKRTVVDGPFAESKELIAGFVILDVPAMADMLPWADRYAEAIGDIEFDIRPVG